MEDCDAEQRQAEQNEINRNAKQVDGLCGVYAKRGRCRGRTCEQATLDGYRGSKKQQRHVHGAPGKELGSRQVFQ